MHKRDHIRVISKYPRVAAEWRLVYQRDCNEKDVEEMFTNFIPLQLAIIEEHATIVPELPEALKVIRSLDMKIGSTTGYNHAMMEILTHAAAKQGYIADSVVCSTDVPSGRPAPWMAYKNAENLGIYPLHAIVKIGDTISDIEEGINAGMWSVGVVMTSNEMGLTLKEINMLDSHELENRKQIVREIFLSAGADYVIDTLAEIGELINQINERLARGEKP